MRFSSTVGLAGVLGLGFCILVIATAYERPLRLQWAPPPANRASNFRRANPMVAIGMIAVFIIVLLGLNRWEFGRFD
jgi:hypothetical protein